MLSEIFLKINTQSCVRRAILMNDCSKTDS